MDGPAESDPFGDADAAASGAFGSEPPQARPQVNGRGTASPEMFDLSRLAPPLSAPPLRMCRTPEAFLGPTGASLVNLDVLISSSPPGKMHQNPFLSGTAWLSSHGVLVCTLFCTYHLFLFFLHIFAHFPSILSSPYFRCFTFLTYFYSIVYFL